MSIHDANRDRKLRMQREASNKALLAVLTTIVETYGGDLRFGQIMESFEFIKPVIGAGGIVMGWENEFYLEPDRLLERVNEAFTRLQMEERERES